jgi:C4-dicarboxylate-specific signal transduction histidine kinase
VIDGPVATWLMGGTALAGAAIMKSIDWFLSRRKERTETDANVALVQGLTERIERLEKSQEATSKRLDEEIAMRHKAEEAAHKLRLRIYTLESTLRGLGAVIPPEPPP